MTKNKNRQEIVESIPEADLLSFKRTQRFETAKNFIQIVLMGTLAAALVIFLTLIVIAGVTHWLPDTEGVQALSKLFSEIAGNAKTVALFALGFFFREYLNARLISSK